METKNFSFVTPKLKDTHIDKIFFYLLGSALKRFSMRSSFLGLCFLLFSPLLWGGEDPIGAFTQDLSKKQKALLNEFFMTVVESSGGYVLYGNKPMSVEKYDLSSLRILSARNIRTVSFIKGKELWEDLHLPLENKEYVLMVFGKEADCQIVCINRRAFLQSVAENLPLFRYVLGPAVTPESLLRELVAAKDQFYTVLKGDKVLLEILLGQDKQNAIVHSRMEAISDPTAFGGHEEFPLISKKLCRAWALSSKKYNKEPSFGFRSIAEEELALNKLANSEETRTLFSTYEQNYGKILKAIGSQNFFETTLRKLFTTTSQALKIPNRLKAIGSNNFFGKTLQKFFTKTSQVVDVPSVPQQRHLCLPVNREETIAKLIEIIQKRIGMEPCGIQRFQMAFMQGVAAREKGKEMPARFQLKRFNDILAIQNELECCKNLKRADAYFNRLASRKDLVSLIPNEIYYKVLKSGKGANASAKLKKVSLQYSFQILGDQKSKDWGIVKEESLGALIPGIVYPLVGMQIGEERVVYIHPRHAYGENTFYPPNVPIVAQIRLLNFEEGDQVAQVLPSHSLENRDYKDLLTKFEVLRGEEYFDEGMEFWDEIKKSGDFIDFSTFQKFYSAPREAASTFLNIDQEKQFVVDLEYHLLSLQETE